MIRDKDVTLVGKVNKTHGVNGEMSATFFSEQIYDAIGVDTCLIFNIDGILTPFFVDGVRPRGADSLLISFEGEDNQEQAATFVGKEIFMHTSELPTEDQDIPQLVAAQLIGYRAITDDGSDIGTIVDIIDNEDNPLFVVERSGTMSYIPIVDDFISSLSLEDKTITFELPQGLLEL